MIISLYKKFQHWSENGGVWIFSDPHFDDFDTKFMDNDWPDPQTQLNIINNKVNKHDTFICLGDCGDLNYFNQLKCQNRVLIKGNHDDGNKENYYNYFSEVYSGPLFISDKILLSHEPIYSLNFCVNIHGHDHNSKFKGVQFYYDEYGAKHINVAANIINYTPLNLKKLIQQGLISDIPNIHRITIDKATENKLLKINKEEGLNNENY